ncbi:MULTISPECIES: hypothetical protein [Nocardiopsidaceae]|uniref:Beta/gamma crystallin 'Greek key' domain-containing protein n=1 Tax=Streptomonospora salina TaxID=104205 RepID=A0A841EID9_9ACTN|nr:MULTISPECIES: hypothetical protein [Nocardiopsaceae]MBB5999171.1 hypothetical protein [Streptomonospora salina]
MPARALALVGAALAAAALASPAPASAQPATAPAEADAGSLEIYAAPGVGYHEMHVPDGCHTYERSRTITFADAEPIATYYFYSGPDCTGNVVGAGRDDTQWMPALDGVESVRIDFE